MNPIYTKLRAFCSTQDEGTRGSAMAEFAFAFPLQMILTFGILQMILLMVSGLTVNYAATRACRAAIVDEDPAEAARVILAPLAGRSITGGSGETVELDGWGVLSGSKTAQDKLSIVVDEDTSNGLVTATVTFEQELVFPFIDVLLGMVMGQASDDRGFGGMNESSGRAKVYPGDRVHVLITRSHTMSKNTDIDVSVDSNVYTYTW